MICNPPRSRSGIDARQRAYYWIGLRRRKAVPPQDSDLGAVHANKIAVTPLHTEPHRPCEALAKMRESLRANLNERLKAEHSAADYTVKAFLTFGAT